MWKCGCFERGGRDRDRGIEQEGNENPAPVSAPYRSTAQVSGKVSGSTIIRITYLPASLPPAISISRQSESQRRICLVASHRLPSVICLTLYEWQPVVSRSHENACTCRYIIITTCNRGYRTSRKILIFPSSITILLHMGPRVINGYYKTRILG